MFSLIGLSGSCGPNRSERLVFGLVSLEFKFKLGLSEVGEFVGVMSDNKKSAFIVDDSMLLLSKVSLLKASSGVCDADVVMTIN